MRNPDQYRDPEPAPERVEVDITHDGVRYTATVSDHIECLCEHDVADCGSRVIQPEWISEAAKDALWAAVDKVRCPDCGAKKPWVFAQCDDCRERIPEHPIHEPDRFDNEPDYG